MEVLMIVGFSLAAVLAAAYLFLEVLSERYHKKRWLIIDQTDFISPEENKRRPRWAVFEQRQDIFGRNLPQLRVSEYFWTEEEARKKLEEMMRNED